MTLRQKSSLATIAFVALSLSLFFLPKTSLAQFNGCPDFGFYEGERTSTCDWQTLQVGPREEWDFNVEQGVTYIWSFVQGGGNASWDTQLTGFREGPGTIEFANDDFDASSGNYSSEVIWTSNFTGQIDLLVTRYNCVGYGSQGSATLAYQKAAPSVSIDQGNQVNTCNGLTSLSATHTYDSDNAVVWSLVSGAGSVNPSTGSVSGIPVNSSGLFQAEADNGGCTAASTITVYNRTPEQVVVSGGGTYCTSATLNASNGLGGTIYWQGTTAGGTSTATPSFSETVNVSGTYYFRSYNATYDCWGAEASVDVIIKDPVLTSPLASTSICEGESVTLSASYSDGISPTYQWEYDDGSGFADVVDGVPTGSVYAGANTTSLTITGLSSAGDYRLRVDDAGAGCGTSYTNSASISINPLLDAIDSITSSGSGCGSLLLTANSDEISSGGYTADFYRDDNLNGSFDEGVDVFVGSGSSVAITSPGTQTIFVRQRNVTTGCNGPAVDTTITIGATFSFSATSQTDITCYGGNDGTATVTPDTTAVAPISYAWSHGLTSSGGLSSSAASLVAGNYTVTATDASGCSATEVFTISQPNEVFATVASTDPSCFGSADGNVSIVPSGGSGTGYTYQWTPAPGGSGFDAGNYSLVVSDDNGCQSSAQITASFQNPLPVSISSSVGNNCGGSLIQSASIELTATGGTSPYTFFQEAGSADVDVTTQLPLTSSSSSFSEDFYASDANGCLSNIVNVVTPLVGQSASSDPTAYCGNFIYVSPSGGGNAGTPDCPMALDSNLWNEVTSTRNIIRLLEGNYNLSEGLDIPADVILDGGYSISNNGDWFKSLSSTSNIQVNDASVKTADVNGVTVGHYIGMDILGDNVTIQDLTLNVLPNGASGYTNQRGRSIYGIYANTRSNINIYRVNIATGDASNGGDGSTPISSVGANNGGAGGNHTDGTDRGCGGNVPAGASGASGGGTGGGSGGAGGVARNGDDCDWWNPLCGASWRKGRNGQTGLDGSSGNSFSANDRPNSNNAVDSYYLPNDQSASGVDGAGGGGGGGGSGGEKGTACTCLGGSEPRGDGGDGGAGGAGGLGGTGGFGGGGNFGAYFFNCSNSDFQYNSMTLGSSGFGGVGAAGQQGKPGAQGQSGVSAVLQGTGNCGGNNDASGGRGGNGGNGGNGGRGRDGANGLSSDFVVIGGGVSTNLLNGNTAAVELHAKNICAYSEVLLIQNSGVSSQLFGNWILENDVTNALGSTTLSDDTAKIYTTSNSGSDNVVINGIIYEDFLRTNSDRVLPEIDAEQSAPFTLSSTSSYSSISSFDICANSSIVFSVGNSTSVSPITTEYEWTIIDLDNANAETTPNGGSSGSQTTHSFANAGGNYQVRLRVNSSCCGWSVPVYMDINVSEGPVGTPVITSSSSSFTFCIGDTVTLGLTGLSGANSFAWQAPAGSIIEGGTNTYTGSKDTVEVVIGSISGDFTALGLNDCNQSSASASQSGTFVGRPIVTMANDTVEVCDGDLVYISSSVAGGTSPYQYDWSGVTSTADSVQYTSSDSTYYVTVTDVNGCLSNTESTTIVNVARPIAGSLSIPGLGGGLTQTICGGTPINDIVVSGASGTSYRWISGALDLQTGGAVSLSDIPGETSLSLTGASFGSVSENTLFYLVSSTGSACPEDTSDLPSIANTSPPTYAGKDTIICDGDVINLNGTVDLPFSVSRETVSNSFSNVSDNESVLLINAPSGSDSLITIEIEIASSTDPSLSICGSAYAVEYSSNGSNWRSFQCSSTGFIVSNSLSHIGIAPSNDALVADSSVYIRFVDLDGNNDNLGTVSINAAYQMYGAANTVQFEWSPSTYLSTTTSLSPQVNATDTITYTLTGYELNLNGDTTCIASDDVVVTVNTLPTEVTAFAGDDTICSGTSTTLTAVGGTEGSGATYEWYASGPGVGPILSTTNSVTVSPSASISYYVRRIPTSTGCSTPTGYFSDEVVVNATPTAPSAGGSIITAGNSTTLSASGAGPNDTYNWYDDLTGGSAVATGPTYNTSVLTTTTTYYVEIEDVTGSCPSSRTPVTVTVNPAPSFMWTGANSRDWNDVSNWASGLVPGLADIATIPSSGVVNYPMITGTADLGPTVIEVGATMSVAPGGVLNVLDVFANNGTLTLMSDGNGDGVLMDTASAAQFSGSITVERYNPGDQFHILGSPVVANLSEIADDVSGPLGNGLIGIDGVAVSPDLTTQTYLSSFVCDSLNVGSNYGNVFSYDESLANNCSFEGWVVESAGVMEPGKGYMTFLVPGSTLDFTGTPNTGSVTTPSMTNSGGGIFSGAGWNLLSNPYPSYVNTSDFIVANPGINSPNTFTDTGVYTGSYQSILPVTGQNIIAIAQGFVMRNGANAATPPIAPTFTNAMRSSTGTGFRTNLVGLQVDVMSENGRDKTEVFFVEGATEGFDVMGDGVKHQSQIGRPTISTRFENDPMGVQTYPLTDDLSRVIELDVRPGLSTNFSFEVDADRIPLAYDVFLIDRVNQTRQNVRTTMSLEIINDSDVIESSRFAVEISKASSTTSIDDVFANVMIWDANGTIIVDPSNASFSNDYRIEVFDMLGRLIISAPNAEGVTELDLVPHRGYVNIRLSGGGSIMTTKLFVK